MKKALFQLCLAGVTASLLSACEAEQITPNKAGNETILSEDPPGQPGPEDSKIAPQKNAPLKDSLFIR
jgi:hypothetical protein